MPTLGRMLILGWILSAAVPAGTVGAQPPASGITATLASTEAGAIMNGEWRFDLRGGPTSARVSLDLEVGTALVVRSTSGAPARGRLIVTLEFAGTSNAGLRASAKGTVAVSGRFVDESGAQSAVKGRGEFSGSVNAPIGRAEAIFRFDPVEFEGGAIESPQSLAWPELPSFTFAETSTLPPDTRRPDTPVVTERTRPGAGGTGATGGASVTGGGTAGPATTTKPKPPQARRSDPPAARTASRGTTIPPAGRAGEKPAAERSTTPATGLGAPDKPVTLTTGGTPTTGGTTATGGILTTGGPTTTGGTTNPGPAGGTPTTTVTSGTALDPAVGTTPPGGPGSGVSPTSGSGAGTGAPAGPAVVVPGSAAGTTPEATLPTTSAATSAAPLQGTPPSGSVLPAPATSAPATFTPAASAPPLAGAAGGGTGPVLPAGNSTYTAAIVVALVVNLVLAGAVVVVLRRRRAARAEVAVAGSLSPAMLVYPAGGSGLARIRLTGPTSIGRDPSNTLRIDDEQASREHAVIEPDGRGWQLRDLGSVNGTRVNGEAIRSKRLEEGDEIRIGACVIRFHARADT